MTQDSPTLRPTPAKIAKQAVLIGLVAFLSYAYFYSGGGWNQNTRFDFVRAVVERGTFQIDAYQGNTGDKAYKDGHFYSDKAPGQPLLAVPAAIVTRSVMRPMGLNPLSTPGLVATSYVCTLFSVALPTALACACLFWIALRLGASNQAAGFAALAMGLGTPIWAYATLLWAHALAGACLLFAFAAVLRIDPVLPGGEMLWGFIAGAMAGWATVTEYPAAPASAILAVFALARVWNSGWHRRLRVAGGTAVGALLCIAALMLYLRAAFGSVLHTSYSYYDPAAFPWMNRGFHGLRYPRLDVVFKLLCGLKRGLFIAAPVLLAAPLGLRLLWRRPATRLPALAATGIFLYYLLFNASFGEWSAGWSYGPRYMAAGIPLLCVGLAPAWDRFRRSGKKVLLVLLGVSVLLSLVAVSTTPQPPFEYRSPITQLLWPSFWHGNLALEHTSVLAPFDPDADGAHGAFNLGQLIGLRGLSSLLPLLAIWVMAVAVWIRLTRSPAISQQNRSADSRKMF
jgi:hypothetical protein